MHHTLRSTVRALRSVERSTNLRALSKRAQIRRLQSLHNPSILSQTVSEPSDDAIPITNPSTNTIITHVPLTSPSSLSSILPTPQRTREWRETPMPARLSHLERLRNLISEHANDLAHLIHIEVGTPLSEAVAEVNYALNLLSWSAQPALQSSQTSYTRYSPHHHTFSGIYPIGPVLAISPFNLPFAIAVRKLAPALAAGCTVLAKPSEKAVLPALALTSLVEEAGIPKGVYTPVIGGKEIIEPLLAGDHVRMLSFTGSTTVGRLLQQQARWKRCLLELGGNAPFIVFEDCDMNVAVKDLVRNGLRCAGQTCISANRVFVHESIYEEFVDELARRVQRVKVGPVIDENAKSMVVDRIGSAVEAGAEVVIGGESSGCFIQPAVLRNVDDSMEIVEHETFGPVFSLMRFNDEQEVLERANNRGGLAGYVYTNNVNKGLRMVDRMNAGMVGLNSVNLSSGETDFGGMLESGLGREGGLGSIEGYSERKFCVIGG